MNWLDIVLIIALIFGFLYGLKTGLIGAAFMAIGVIVGWQFAGHYADDLGSSISNSVGNDTIVSVIAYAAIIVAGLVVAGIAGKIIKPVLTVFTLGMSAMVDKLGGLVLGLLLAALLSGAAILGLTRLAYNFELPNVPEDGIAGTVADKLPIPDTLEIKEGLQSALVESSFVRTFVSVVDKVPGDAIGFVPNDFEVSVQILKDEIDSEKP
jgi:uncharacterized membrane protein required for colicin V production